MPCQWSVAAKMKALLLGLAVVVTDSALQLYLKYVVSSLGLDLPFLFVLLEMVVGSLVLGAYSGTGQFRAANGGKALQWPGDHSPGQHRQSMIC